VWLHGSPVGLRFSLPPRYPDTHPPSLSVECAAGVPADTRERLGAALQAAVDDAGGCECLLAASALRDAAVEAGATEGGDAPGAAEGERGCSASAPGDESPRAGPAGGSAMPAGGGGGSSTVVRTVVWFHHIKSMCTVPPHQERKSERKRKHIVEQARCLRLGGFSKPGFPGE
jgi:hypothetical protein